MRQNVGTSDRILGLWLLAVAVSAFRVGRRAMAATTGIAGLGLVQNAVTGFCGCNWLFSIDTTCDGDGACRR
ncbi:hypothetical protein C453_14828 [Haloferax elongans ATCC BAA-1513]|uniref:Inner membrane protein YgaP-like transmembrane domain-containing protein n=1 Tax=Haloferax elongans ATCC BAA-1513 TaxID=1230453 RepID=M0HH03_HALEO|nr:DUF2892 domain-containing protein [Haloferax elongans]ELZ82369.1 hypothetical protein C453_14828 [Haloferax elongans ATCC BAA-1513]